MGLLALAAGASVAQIGQRFPSERRVLPDPVTGVPLVFLTTQPRGDSKIYPTHPQWTADGQWLVFRSDRAGREAIAVHEASGEMVQVSEGGYSGMLNLDPRANRLVFLRELPGAEAAPRGSPRAMQAVEVDLDRLFADSRTGRLKPDAEARYQRVIATIAPEWQAEGDSALDADGQWLYFRIGRDAAARHAPPGLKTEPTFGPRNMGAGPTGIARVHRRSGELQHVLSVGFQIGHIQANPWQPGELVFSWETGGKSPQRTWTVRGDGSGLRPLYPELPHEWVTHEAVITRDEAAFAIMGHRPIPAAAASGPAGTGWEGANPGQEAAWGPSGTRERPTGLGIVNLRTREMRIEAQTPSGSGLWHVHGSPDGRWAVGDDFSRRLYLLDRRSGQLRLLSTGHRDTARDHPHPTFSADGKRIQIQSAMLAPDGRAMNIVVITVPEAWQAEAAAPR
ncbi:MAG: PD40 domain-containing protein [Burkholderiales bacterium]|nr:PD40 domain-containing protein [Burkholderiales bacterium]